MATSLPTIDSLTTALLLVDLQRTVVALPTAPLSAEEVVANARLLADSFHRKKAQVILVRVVASPDGKDRLRPETDKIVVARAEKLPEDWAEIVPELAPRDGDVVIDKRQWGAFYGTDLDLQLRRRGITTIILGGIATNFGVESTARDAYERGYQLIFGLDAMTGLSAADHEFAVTRIFPAIGRVRTVSEIISALEGETNWRES